MLHVVQRLPGIVNRTIISSALRCTSSTNALSAEIRFKSTRANSTQRSKNAESLRLSKTAECPEQPVKAETAAASETSQQATTQSQNFAASSSPSSASLNSVPSQSAAGASAESSAGSSSSSSGSENSGGSGNTNYLLIAGGALLAIGAGYLFTKNSPSKKSPEVDVKSAEKELTSQQQQTRFPPTTENIPKHIPYLLIGGGTASFAAFRSIKSNQPAAKVLVISDEAVMPYMRPPLSKEIWFDSNLGMEQSRFKQWNGAERSLFYEPNEFYMPAEKLEGAKNGGVSVIRGYKVVSLDVKEQKVVLDDGTELTYDKCLIATGSTPKTLDIFDSAPARTKKHIFTYKSIKDFQTVKEQLDKSNSIAIIGNGFLGSELACAFAHNGQVNQRTIKVYQLFHESGNMAKVLPKYLSEWATERIREVGVDVLPESQVTKVEEHEGDKVKLTLNNGKSVVVDTVIQAVGSEPNVALARNAKLEIDPKLGGLVVNPELEARSNLYVAGDVACFYDPRLGRRRVEHHDHAVVSGRLAGENMVGLKKPYKHQSMFWSDLGSAVGYEAIGRCDSSLETYGVFAKIDPKDVKNEHTPQKDNETAAKVPETSVTVVDSKSKVDADNFTKGVLFYRDGDKIVGILLWNVFNRMSIARKILQSDDEFKDLNEVAKLFDIFDQHSNEDKQN